MIPRFDQINADKILQSVMFINRNMLRAYQANATNPLVSHFCYFNDQIFDMLFTMAYSNNVGLSDIIKNHDSNIAQIISLLNKKCTKRTKVNDRTRWSFDDYGFSIQELSASKNATSAKIHKGLWIYEYNQTLACYIKTTGVISGNDIERIFAKLIIQPNALDTKPDRIIELEDHLGVQAVRHKYFFGRWTLNRPDFVSIVCNPFGLDCGQSSAADNFDTYYENDTAEGFVVQTVDTIKDMYATYLSKPSQLFARQNTHDHNLLCGDTTEDFETVDTTKDMYATYLLKPSQLFAQQNLYDFNLLCDNVDTSKTSSHSLCNVGTVYGEIGTGNNCAILSMLVHMKHKEYKK